MQPIKTSRLSLVPAGIDLLLADLEAAGSLASRLRAVVPDTWPPPLFDHDAIRFALEAHRAGLMRDQWTFYYILLSESAADEVTAIGIGGFKSQPDAAGQIEVGYAILPLFQKRGFATEALNGWTDFALSHQEVSVVFAQTLAGHKESIRVAEMAGFTLAGRGEDPDAPPGQEVLRFEWRRR